MNRLTKLFQDKQNKKEKVLSIFVTAGYPELEITPDLVFSLEQAGADLVEIGIPFSDPIADGPTIQKASQIALENGMKLEMALEQVQIIRKQSQIPLILMGYINPFLKYGLRNIIQDSEEAGADGFIIPDLIPEEFIKHKNAFSGSKLGLNFLVSPITTKSRIKTVDNLTRDFIYCVAVTGVTGVREGVPQSLIDFLQSLKDTISHPYLVGFGISNPRDASIIAQNCHGIIVGSALINEISKYSSSGEMLTGVSQFVQEFKSALK